MFWYIYFEQNHSTGKRKFHRAPCTSSRRDRTCWTDHRTTAMTSMSC